MIKTFLARYLLIVVLLVVFLINVAGVWSPKSVVLEPVGTATAVNVSDTDFEQVVGAFNGAVVVDFWAEGCGPCRMMEEDLSKIMGKFVGKIKYAKVNVDKTPNLEKRFKIEYVPTLIFFRNGEVVHRSEGIQILIKQGELEDTIRSKLL